MAEGKLDGAGCQSSGAKGLPSLIRHAINSMIGSDLDLLDANVWLALVVDRHVHHNHALDWFQQGDSRTCVFCRVTQMALLRHLTNERIMGPNALAQEQAWALYDRLIENESVVYLSEPDNLEKYWRKFSRKALSQKNLWTDAYLAAFATGHGMRLVTFDRGITKFPGTDVVVLTAGL